MRIGLAGAPGSGKTDLANALASLMGADLIGGQICIVDDYVKDVEQTTDLACGFQGSYIADMAVAMARYGAERSAVRDGAETTITCGTLAETTTYTAINATLRQDEWGWAMANISMPYYALLSRSVMAYDHLFYLPLVGSDVELFKAMDENIVGSFEAFRTPAITLTGEDMLARANEALAHLQADA